MSSMRRAQRIVQLQSEVLLRAIEWREACQRRDSTEIGPAYSNALLLESASTERLKDLVGRLVDELEHLAVPA